MEPNKTKLRWAVHPRPTWMQGVEELSVVLDNPHRAANKYVYAVGAVNEGDPKPWARSTNDVLGVFFWPGSRPSAKTLTYSMVILGDTVDGAAVQGAFMKTVSDVDLSTGFHTFITKEILERRAAEFARRAANTIYIDGHRESDSIFSICIRITFRFDYQDQPITQNSTTLLVTPNSAVSPQAPECVECHFKLTQPPRRVTSS